MGKLTQHLKDTKDYLNTRMSIAASNVLMNTSSVAIDNTVITKNFSEVLYTGNGDVQTITTGISSIDFTQPNNGTGYYNKRVGSGFAVVADSAVDLITSSTDTSDAANWTAGNSANLSSDGTTLSVNADDTNYPYALETIQLLAGSYFLSVEATGTSPMMYANLEGTGSEGRLVNASYTNGTIGGVFTLTEDGGIDVYCLMYGTGNDDTATFSNLSILPIETSGSVVGNVSRVHIKCRSYAYDNTITDGLRSINHDIRTNTTGSENTVSGGIISFNDNGISVGDYAVYNKDTETYVLYQTLYTHIKWGLTSHNKFCVEAYNPITKQGMILYEGSGSAGHQIPHSAGVKVDYSEIKNLSIAKDWDGAILDTNRGHINLDNPLDGVITSNDDKYIEYLYAGNNYNGNYTYITYYKAKSTVWINGTYIGTGVAGNKIVTKDSNGNIRKPLRVIIKRVDDVGNWSVFDKIRNDDKKIYLNLSDEETTDAQLSLTSNGFTLIVGSGSVNALNGQYYYEVEFDTNAISDTPDGSYFDKPVDSSDADATDTTTTTADYTTGTIVKDSTSGKMYKAIVDTLADDLLTNTDKFKSLSTLSITDGTFISCTGIDGQGYVHNTEKYSGTIDFSGESDGWKWVGKKADNSFIFLDKKPEFSGDYVKTSADDNRWILNKEDGRLYDTVGGELVVGGNFDTQADVDLINSTTGTVSLSSGKLRVTQDGSTGEAYTQYVDTIIGEEYRISCNDIGGTANGYFFPVKADDSYYVSLGYNTTGNLSATFIASETTTRVKFRVIDGTDDYAEFDNISIFKTKPTIGTMQEPTSFLKKPVMVASETPMMLEADSLADTVLGDVVAGNIECDNIEAKDIVADTIVSKNQCTAWVNFDGRDGSIRDSFNVAYVLREATGKYRVYFDSTLETPDYSATITAGWDSADSATDSRAIISSREKDYFRFLNREDDATNNYIDNSTICVSIMGGIN